MILFVIRLGLAIILGWYLMALPFYWGLNTWAFFHSGLVLVVFPFSAAFCFWLVGKLLPFRSRRTQIKQSDGN
jgi:hypothetical protein